MKVTIVKVKVKRNSISLKYCRNLNRNVFTVTLDHFNASLQNFLSKK